MLEQIVRMNLAREHKLHTRQVPRPEIQLLVQLARSLDQQRRLFRLKLVERRPVVLGLRLVDVEVLHHRQLAVGNLRRQRRAQRTQQLLLRELVLVAARLRSVNRSAATPQRRTDRAHASAARALLLPQLASRTRNQLAVLGGMRSLPQAGAVVFHRLPQKRLVHLAAKHLVEQFEVADFLARQALDLDLRHRLTSLSVPAIDAANPIVVTLLYPACSPRRGCCLVFTLATNVPKARPPHAVLLLLAG